MSTGWLREHCVIRQNIRGLACDGVDETQSSSAPQNALCSGDGDRDNSWLEQLAIQRFDRMKVFSLHENGLITANRNIPTRSGFPRLQAREDVN
ncbi:hypothetical protein HALLA_01185 (plasmid) [Halostagnicola larsenii XH-48]|uniref:Uncharacterized protein n=1 Tax=Halostagnicola larsenii XH-48 TaxID=797299 RepID=W0JXJ6_9EURY|nr:hypothetical protein HALLA_01185 [Halostagnicola larsenii XH-48]